MPIALTQPQRSLWKQTTHLPFCGIAKDAVDSLLPAVGGFAYTRTVGSFGVPTVCLAFSDVFDVCNKILYEPDIVLAGLTFAFRVHTSESIEIRIDPHSVPLQEDTNPSFIAVEGWVTSLSTERLEVKETLFACKRCSGEVHCGEYPPTACCCGCREFSVSRSLCDNVRSVVLRGFATPSEHIIDMRSSEEVEVGLAIRVVGIKGGGRLRAHSCVVLRSGWRTVLLERENAVRSLVRANHAGILHLAVNSAFPSVMGHELAKCCLLLSVIGGCERANAGITYPAPINILLVGESGTGKSSLLRAASDASPRNSFVSMKDATIRKIGPTVEASNIVSGAASEANMGSLCVDDVQLASQQAQRAMLQAVSEACFPAQHCSGVVKTHANIALLAAATLPQGRAGSTLTSLLPKMHEALLSSFDIVIPIASDGGDTGSTAVATFVLDAYAASKGSEATSQRTRALSIVTHDPKLPLRARLCVDTTERRDFEPMPLHLLHELVCLAKSISPRFTQEGAAAVSAFCRRLKQHETQQGGVLGGAVHAGFACTLVKLCQARARVDLCDIVSRQHILDAMELLLEIRGLPLRDGGGVVQLPGGGGGGGGGKAKAKGTKKQALSLMRALNAYCERQNGDNVVPLTQVQAIGRAQGMDKETVATALRKLHNEGVVIKTASGKYRLLSGEG